MFLLIILFFVKLNEVYSADNPFLIQLEAEQIINTFENLISSAYIKSLAREFAEKAAKHFIKQMRTKDESQNYRYVLSTHNTIELTYIDHK